MAHEILSFSDGEIILDTGLSSQAFSRIHIDNEEGFCVTFTGSESQITCWSFERNFTDEKDRVFFAERMPEGKTLSSIFENGTSEELLRSSAAAVSALTAIIHSIDEETGGDIHALHSVGAGGIVISNDFRSVFFCPCGTFTNSADRQDSETQTALQGIWENKALFSKASLSFTRAAIAYRALCGKNAFSALSVTERQADIYDRNFIPSALLNPALSEKTSAALDEGLNLAQEINLSKSERRFLSEKQKNAIEHSRKVISSFPLEEIVSDLKKFEQLEQDGWPALTEQQKREVEKWKQAKKRSVMCRRFIRRNQKMLIVSAAALLAFISIAVNFHRENGKLADTTGLTAEQTVQTLYTGIHRADVSIIREVYKGKGRQDLLEIVSGYYITYKQRLAFSQDDATVSPAAWLFLQNQTNYWMYGITDFYIGDEKESFPYAYPVRNEKRQRLTPENGGGIKGEEREIHVSYNLVHTDSSNRVVIDSVEETVLVRWNGKRWIVQSIKGKTKPSSVSLKSLKEAYGKALKDAGGNVPEAARALREKYTWIPDEDEMEDGARAMEKEYAIKAATDFLESRK